MTEIGDAENQEIGRWADKRAELRSLMAGSPAPCPDLVK